MATQKFLALLRGINVGGRTKVSMSELKSALGAAGYDDVKSYINSGNIIFSSSSSDTTKLALDVEAIIEKHFGFHVDVVVLTQSTWAQIIKEAPQWWGHDETRKHNMLIFLKPTDVAEAMKAIGALKPDIESAQAGSGVVYQSLSIKDFGKTTTGKLASSTIYKQMTIRNYNTAVKLVNLFD